MSGVTDIKLVSMEHVSDLVVWNVQTLNQPGRAELLFEQVLNIILVLQLPLQQVCVKMGKVLCDPHLVVAPMFMVLLSMLKLIVKMFLQFNNFIPFPILLLHFMCKAPCQLQLLLFMPLLSHMTLPLKMNSRKTSKT